MGDVLAFVEHREGSFRGVSREVITAATAVAEGTGGKVHALALGGPGLSAAAASLQGHGAAKIRVSSPGLPPTPKT